MRFNQSSARYQLFDAKSQSPLFADDKDKKTDKNPKKGFPDQDDDDLKNVDQSRGGYGDDTGFDKE